MEHVIQETGIIPVKTIPLQKKILFSLWVIAKPECFLAAGDRFGLARSTAHKTFKEVVATLVHLMPQFVSWGHNFGENIRVRNGLMF